MDIVAFEARGVATGGPAAHTFSRAVSLDRSRPMPEQDPSFTDGVGPD
jgi:hypothetical protein